MSSDVRGNRGLALHCTMGKEEASPKLPLKGAALLNSLSPPSLAESDALTELKNVQAKRPGSRL